MHLMRCCEPIPRKFPTVLVGDLSVLAVAYLVLYQARALHTWLYSNGNLCCIENDATAPASGQSAWKAIQNLSQIDEPSKDEVKFKVSQLTKLDEAVACVVAQLLLSFAFTTFTKVRVW